MNAGLLVETVTRGRGLHCPAGDHGALSAGLRARESLIYLALVSLLRKLSDVILNAAPASSSVALPPSAVVQPEPLSPSPDPIWVSA